jgi:ribonuclease VapC
VTDSRKIFIDTSAVIAVLTQEQGHSLLIEKMRDASSLCTSPLVILEASMRLATILGVTPSDAENAIRALLEGAGADICPIEEKRAKLAVGAFERYGKGRGHPAQLNLADCFSYACARQQNCAILFVGNDFSQTDLVAA